MLYAEYSTRGGVERTIQDEAKPSAVLFSRPCSLPCYNYYIKKAVTNITDCGRLMFEKGSRVQFKALTRMYFFC